MTSKSFKNSTLLTNILYSLKAGTRESSQLQAAKNSNDCRIS